MSLIIRGLVCAFSSFVVTFAAMAQPFLSSDHNRPMAKRGLEIGRTFAPSTSGTLNPAPRVPTPAIIAKAEWGGGESSGTMRSHFPVQLTLHHVASGKPITPENDPAKDLQNLQKWGWRDKGWPDLPYHFLIDLDGRIYEGRDPRKAGDTNTKYEPAGKLLISMMGNFELQAPNVKQLTAIADLMAWGSDYYNIPPETIRGHMEFIPTGCPGKYLYPFVVSGFLEGEVRERLKKAYSPEPAAGDAATTKP